MPFYFEITEILIQTLKMKLETTVIILVIIVLVSEGECDQERRHHRRRHRHRHITTTEENTNDDDEAVSTTEEPTFLAAFKTNQTGSEESTPNNLQSRLAHLEQYVRYLCLEDEEDVDRRIRHLGIKCVCPKTEAPVCGSDDVTYYNRCFLQCRAQQALLSYHRYRITLKKFGAC